MATRPINKDKLGKKLYKTGDQGFTSITYKGHPIKHDYIEDRVETMYVKHFRRTSFMSTDKGRHACLKMGYWCWQNALQYPQDIITYIRKKN